MSSKLKRDLLDSLIESVTSYKSHASLSHLSVVELVNLLRAAKVSTMRARISKDVRTSRSLKKRVAWISTHLSSLHKVARTQAP